MKTNLILTFIMIAMVASAQERGSFIDNRDSKTYKMVKIGTQIWMSENLNFETKDSWCFNNDTANCRIYGRLYFYLEAAKDACPKGWHIPTKVEFEILINFLGGEQIAGAKLKVGGTSGFNALVTDSGINDRSFDNLALYGHFWTSTSQEISSTPYQLIIYAKYNWISFQGALSKKILKDRFNGYSIRCIKDDKSIL